MCGTNRSTSTVRPHYRTTLCPLWSCGQAFQRHTCQTSLPCSVMPSLVMWPGFPKTHLLTKLFSVRSTYLLVCPAATGNILRVPLPPETSGWISYPPIYYCRHSTSLGHSEVIQQSTSSTKLEGMCTLWRCKSAQTPQP